MPHTALTQYWNYLDGTAKAIGLVTGGEMGWNPNLQERLGIAGQSALAGGSMSAAGNVNVLVQNKAFFTTAGNVLRASATNPVINPFTIEGGGLASILDDGSDFCHTGAKVASCRFSSAINGALAAAIAWIGTGYTEGAGNNAANATNLTYEWFEGVVTVDGATMLVQSMDIEVITGVQPYYSHDVKASQKRFPDGLTIGHQYVNLNCDVITFPGSTRAVDWVLADAVDRAISASFAYTGSDTMTLALANLSCSGIGIPFKTDDGAVVYPLSFRARADDTGAITIT